MPAASTARTNGERDREGVASSDWGGERVVTAYDERSGTWMFVCMHSTRLGPAAGGTRMRAYAEPSLGLLDGQRLSCAMTRKWAVAGLPFGGGKAVLAVPEVPRGQKRRRLLRAYADLIESLGGGFLTGPDMNTSTADMDVIGERTRHVFCRSEARGGSGDPSPSTALGVFLGLRASVNRALGTQDLRGVRVLVQGVGAVGAALAGLLVQARATVIVTDVAAERAAEVADRWGVQAIPPRDALGARYDVLAPCAVGGVLNAKSIPRLPCRVVAGSANNQLATPEDGQALREAGILYAPDYVISAGGILHAIGLEVLGWTRAQLEARLDGIGDTLRAVYRIAEDRGLATEAAAEELARARLDAIPAR